MDSTRGIGGVIGAIVWILINDVGGGIAGLAVGWMAVACVEPIVGGLAECVLLVTVPLGLFAGGLIGFASLGWLAELSLADPRPALSHS
jgi:hypothetical protein